MNFAIRDDIEETIAPELEIDEDLYIDNPNEAVAAPRPEDVQATRLSQFRRGGPVAGYPVPNSTVLDWAAL